MFLPKRPDSPRMTNQNNSLLDRAKFFREHAAPVLNLATGWLVLSVTFLHDQAGQ
jgi:hypothetical protein